jgi:hypothetical protein|mmetsp:Transcript_760/g.1415  ORF Transcript_760/g.1415 Transcript_760/m.1415 type:complete len:199 (+) Transcript_760:88-684(+)|eukprot:CAMPEP_0202499572 /NCGR_PEP_ID=MMETSP1361-20130828/30192_1 /ASSEMBLY_ACC=CAM_ASM_000849 /TAXON_ID=210615 /ORGANISM="Staurosira complex sp., Strain CCMP2646" /LENGTH=198 /DNA_ID=CAMNT_0049131795 /DNA_START=44 /DNA_END=640 /DNA_ORIENTATION=-
MIKTLILLLCAVSFTASFQINAPLSVSRWRHHHSTEPSTTSQRRTPTLALDLDDDNDSVTQQDYLTPTQVKTLRKEANKRKSRKELKTLVFSDENNANQQHMAAIVHLLEDSELIEIRGISRNEKRHVRRNAERLAFEIEMELQRPVFLLDTKGHAATYYSPGIGDFELRTGYREGQWSKKPRPKRDSRGKIIKGEYE